MRPLCLLLAVVCLAFSLSTAAQSNPVPFLNQPLVPSAVPPGGHGFKLTVNGTSFVAGSNVYWNGVPLATKFVSAAELTAAVPAQAVAKPGSATIKVINPAPGGGSSVNTALFTVTNPTSTVAFKVIPVQSVSLPSPLTLAAADFNNDGKADLAVLVANSAQQPACPSDYHQLGYVAILLGNGDGTFAQPSFVCLPNSSNMVPLGLTLADFNSDGNTDLIVAVNIVGDDTAFFLYLGNGDGTFQSPSELFDDEAGTVWGFAVGNFFGVPDLVISCVNTSGGGGITFASGGDGQCYGAPNSYPPVQMLAAGDFNRDGLLDYVGTGEQLDVFLSEENGTFSRVPGPVVPNQPMVVADFNGDQLPDVLLSNLILLGNGDGSFKQQEAPPGPGFVADFMAMASST
jgi:FG-GAP-like repeat